MNDRGAPRANEDEAKLRNQISHQIEWIDGLIESYPLDYGPSPEQAVDDETSVLGSLIAAVRHLAELNTALRSFVDSGASSTHAGLICGATDASIAMLMQLTGELSAARDDRDDRDAA